MITIARFSGGIFVKVAASATSTNQPTLLRRVPDSSPITASRRITTQGSRRSRMFF